MEHDRLKQIEVAAKPLSKERKKNLIGEQIGAYKIVSFLGKGGMGEVFGAVDERLDRRVALKILSPTQVEDAESLQRFKQEAQTASALNHPNILTIFEIQTAGDICFIATEFIEGETLRQKISDKNLTFGEILEIAAQIADALAAAHAMGIVHRDIKPENIMIRADGLVKILDFGLAEWREAEKKRGGEKDKGSEKPNFSTSRFLTRSGTPQFMSPEQIRGEATDARTDVWSLGVVLFEMLAGQKPFGGDGAAEILNSILRDEPKSLSAFRDDVPLGLEEIVRRALEKNADARYQTAADFSKDLKRLCERSEQPASASGDGRGISDEGRRMNKTLPVKLIPHLSSRLLRFTRPLTRAVPTFFKRQGTAAIRPRGVAFRGLLPFQEADRERFYGREIEAGAVSEMVSHHLFRFGVLFGESGCGKTSLVRAAIIPALREKGFLGIYCRSYKNPVKTLLDECRKQTLIESDETETTIDYLKRVCREVGTIVVVYDQFEEFFVNFKTKRERENFVGFVAGCHDAERLPLKFLFSMRSDFLYLINAEFAEKIPEPLSSAKLYHLRNFNEREAAGVIEKSARRALLPFEKNFSRHIARDLATDDIVLPSELQIVGEQIQSKRIFGKDAYERAGGKESIVYDFLEDVILASGDKESARILLRSLISDENTRLTLTSDEITRRTQRRRKTIERLIQIFTGARLVRVIQDEEPWRYELMHEYLIDKINQITGQALDATQRANRLLRQYAANFSLDKRTRIPLAKLWFVNRYADAPRRASEKVLLEKSLRSGLARVFAALFLLAVLSTIVAAWFSVREDWNEIKLKDGHTAGARRVVLSPDNRLLVSGGEDNKVIVWDFARRERIATLTDHQGWVNWLDFSPDGKFFATASTDKTVIVWDATTFNPSVVLREHTKAVSYVGFSPDGKWMISASYDGGKTIIWKTDGWKKMHEIPLGFEWGQYLFTSDSRRIMRPDGRTYDINTGKQIAGEFEQPYTAAYGAISPDGSLIVGNYGDVMFVKMPERKGLSREKAHQFHGRQVAFSPDGRIAATASEDIILWDALTRAKLFRFNYTTEAWGLAFSRDGRWLVSSYNDGAILLWDLKERKRAASFNEHSASVRSVAFSPGGERLVSASEDQSVIVWNAQNGNKEAVLLGHETRVTSAAFSPDGNWLASADQKGNVTRWDVARRQPVWTFQWLGVNDVPTNIYTLSISQNGRWVATSAGVSDGADGHQVVDFSKLEINDVYGAMFTADNSRLALISARGGIHILDTQTWQKVEEAKSDGTKLICGSYSPDGRWLVTGEDEGSVRLWQTNPLREVAVLGGHKARIKSVAFSPDGAEIVSSGDDQTIALWDVNRRRLIANLGTHTAPVLSVAFSPDGRRVASGEQDNSVRIYTRKRSLWGYVWE